MSAFEKVQIGHIYAELDYVKDGVVYCGVTPKNIMVESESDLDGLEGYVPGSIAFTADNQNIWRLDAQGMWQDTLAAPEAQNDGE